MRGQEALEHRERLEPAPHRRVAEAAGLRQAGADPDGLVDLIGELPPVARNEHVHDQTPRVRAKVDNGHPADILARLAGR